MRHFASSNNQFDNLEFLKTLPNKEKLLSLNFWGNQIEEIDFAELLTNFPNLERINLENNPVKTKNLNNLTAEQFDRLVVGIKERKFRVNSYKGTVLMDLLDYARELVAKGNSNYNAHLQTLTQMASPAEIKKMEVKQNINPIKENSANHVYLIGGLILLIGSVLAIGYWLGKRKKNPPEEE